MPTGLALVGDRGVGVRRVGDGPAEGVLVDERDAEGGGRAGRAATRGACAATRAGRSRAGPRQRAGPPRPPRTGSPLSSASSAGSRRPTATRTNHSGAGSPPGAHATASRWMSARGLSGARSPSNRTLDASGSPRYASATRTGAWSGVGAERRPGLDGERPPGAPSHPSGCRRRPRRRRRAARTGCSCGAPRRAGRSS